jgi:membrane-bound metal-dependent hydrolase YbcI (DUF457 family)
MGYVIHRICGGRKSKLGSGRLGPLPGLFILAAGLSLLPDIDSVAGFLLRDFGRFHNNGSHSLLIGLAVASAVGGLAWWVKRSGFVDWFTLVLLCYQFHIILDYFTVGRGVMLLWPLSSARFQSSVKLFYGLHWSDGIMSVNHVWTLLNELGFVVLAVFVMRFLEHRMSDVKSVRRPLNHPPESLPEES